MTLEKNFKILANILAEILTTILTVLFLRNFGTDMLSKTILSVLGIVFENFRYYEAYKIKNFNFMNEVKNLKNHLHPFFLLSERKLKKKVVLKYRFGVILLGFLTLVSIIGTLNYTYSQVKKQFFESENKPVEIVKAEIIYNSAVTKIEKYNQEIKKINDQIENLTYDIVNRTKEMRVIIDDINLKLEKQENIRDDNKIKIDTYNATKEVIVTGYDLFDVFGAKASQIIVYIFLGLFSISLEIVLYKSIKEVKFDEKKEIEKEKQRVKVERPIIEKYNLQRLEKYVRTMFKRPEAFTKLRTDSDISKLCNFSLKECEFFREFVTNMTYDNKPVIFTKGSGYGTQSSHNVNATVKIAIYKARVANKKANENRDKEV